MTSALILYDAACRAIADARNIDEVKDLHDKAEAMRAYGRQAKNKTLEIDAAEIRLRAERRLGELIGDQKHGGGLATGGQYGGRAKIDGTRAEPSIKTPTLAELGIDKKLSSRAQKIAAVPEATFEAQMASWRERASREDERITVNFIKEHEKAQRREANQAPVEGGGRVEDLLELVKKGVTFGAIYADPPWEFETWSERGQDRSASQHYRTQTLDEIKAMPVAALAATDCILHLWCLSSMLPAALDVVAAWGFTFKKVGFIWNKLNPSGEGRHMGNGKWTRDEAEFCLLATKGAPTRLDASVRQTFDAPITAHSEKPEEFRRRIERLTAGPYLELYGRRAIEGWTVWGDQVRWEAPLPEPSRSVRDSVSSSTLSIGEAEIESDLDIPQFLRRGDTV